MVDAIWKNTEVDNLDTKLPVGRPDEFRSVREEKNFKRSRLERYIDILEVVREFGPIRRTHILYKANLSWGDLEDSLNRLEQAGALQKSVTRSGVRYDITDAGKKFLANLVTVRGLLNLRESASSPDPHQVKS